LIYYKRNERVILFESGEEYFITGASEFDKAYNGLLVLFADGHLKGSEISDFKFTADEISETQAGSKPKSSIMRALMYDKGVNETTLSLITEAIAGRAGYFSAITADLIKRDIKTAIFIIDSGLVCRVSSDKKSSIRCSAIDNEKAMQIALAFIGGNSYV